jgi:DNA-binding NtrC family response regulator
MAQRHRILIIEDDSDVQDVMVATLRAEGCEARSATAPAGAGTNPRDRRHGQPLIGERPALWGCGLRSETVCA